MSLVTNLFASWEFYVTICVIFVVSRIVKWLKDPLRKIPGPRGFPVIGNTLDYSLSKDLHQVFLERSKKYGKIYKDYSVLLGTSVYITDPEYAKQILVTNSSRYARPENLRKLLPALGNGLITSNGKEHALLRKHLNPAFSHASIKEFMPIFNKKAAQFVKYYDDKIEQNDNGPIEMEMMKKFTDLTLDIIGMCAFGYDFNGVLGDSSKESKATNTILTANFNIARRSLEELLPILKLIPSDGLKEAEEVVYGYIEKVIDARKEELETNPQQTSQKHDLLQTFITMSKEAGISASKQELFQHIFNFMLAGHETTSLSLTWFTFLLAKYDEVQPRLRKEIEEALDGRSEFTYDDMDKLKFLDNCIKESMRLYPAALCTSRYTLKDEKFGPYTVPSSTRLLVHIGSLSRDPKYWKNPDEFDPDRFKSQSDQDPLFPYYYLPFSRGPRMCIGYRFVQMEMKVVLMHLFKNFSFKLGKSQSSDVVGTNILTYRPTPAPVIEIRRSSNQD